MDFHFWKKGKQRQSLVIRNMGNKDLDFGEQGTGNMTNKALDLGEQ